jgi:branched-chain amino acid aminotransferase
MTVVDFDVRPNPSPLSPQQREALLVDPGFGRVFTDHMVTIRYADGKGWYDAQLGPRGPLSLDPASAVLHYGQEILEGLKAYRADDGTVTLFRAAANAARFRDSARRLGMPALPDELFLGSVRELVRADLPWLPTDPEGSLYLRPFMYATDLSLSVTPSSSYLYCLIASPVGGYFAGAPTALTLWLSADYVRAAPGGTGAAKCGGNYGGSLAAQQQALDHGCDQVVFLDAVHRRYVEELGAMNIFFCYDGELVTPPLSGSILAGVTRDAVITLAGERGLTVTQRPYAIDEWRADAASGALREVFACGTAAVVTPVGALRSAEGDLTVGDGRPGPLALDLRRHLVDLQRGRAEDRYGWVTRVA